MWFTPRATLLHVTVLIVVPTCLALCDWQVRRALSGNDLSWAYAFEWHFFAAYALYLWWKLVHEQPGLEAARAAAPEKTKKPEPPDAAPGLRESDEDAELAAYNRYLAELDAADRPKHW